MKKITFSNLMLVLLLAVISSLYITSFSDIKDLKNENDELEKKLKEEKQVSVLYERTKEFIEKASVAEHEDFLTGEAKENLENAKAEHGDDYHDDSHNTLDRLNFINVSVVKTKNDGIKSYVIYQAFYNNNPETDDITTQRILTMSVVTDWKKENGQYKVFNYTVDLLQDSADEFLKDLSSNNE